MKTVSWECWLIDFQREKSLLYSHIMKKTWATVLLKNLVTLLYIYLVSKYYNEKDSGQPYLSHFIHLFLWLNVYWIFLLFLIFISLNYIWFKNINRIRKFNSLSLFYQMLWHFDLYTNAFFQLQKVSSIKILVITYLISIVLMSIIIRLYFHSFYV